MAKNLVDGTNIIIEENADNINLNLSSTYTNELTQQINDSFKENNVYSTAETVIGTWINKPLYRKVILVETTTTLHNQGTVIDVPLNLLPVEFMTRFDCITMGNNEINLEINKFIVPDRYDKNNDKVTLNVTTNYTTNNIVVILEYTKTTD